MPDSTGVMSTRSAALFLDSGISLPGEGSLQIAADIIAPENPKPIVLICLPGGAMNRRYFDLRAPGDDSYSFARQMAARGFICVLMDHLGVGESSRPTDGYALTPDVLARANANATTTVLERFHNGMALAGLPPLKNLASIGIGHSMGAMLTILQQAEFRQHQAIAVLGFSTRGLPEYLPAEAKGLAKDPVAVRREMVRLAKAMFRDPYPGIGRSADGNQLYAGAKAESAGVEAIKAARERLLPVPAFMSMLPGNVAPEAAKIEVPVFVGLGELDMAGPPLEAPKAFTSSSSVTLEILPGSGHSHFLFPARQQLFQRLGDWAEHSLSDA